MTGTKPVKLQVYVHHHEHVDVYGYEAMDWGDFLIIEVGTPTDEEFHRFSEQVADQLGRDLQKQVILIPKGWDIQFYGIERAL